MHWLIDDRVDELARETHDAPGKAERELARATLLRVYRILYPVRSHRKELTRLRLVVLDALAASSGAGRMDARGPRIVFGGTLDDILRQGVVTATHHLLRYHPEFEFEPGSSVGAPEFRFPPGPVGTALKRAVGAWQSAERSGGPVREMWEATNALLFELDPRLAAEDSDTLRKLWERAKANTAV
jgi:hypothetical protein